MVLRGELEGKCWWKGCTEQVGKLRGSLLGCGRAESQGWGGRRASRGAAGRAGCGGGAEVMLEEQAWGMLAGHRAVILQREGASGTEGRVLGVGAGAGLGAGAGCRRRLPAHSGQAHWAALRARSPWRWRGRSRGRAPRLSRSREPRRLTCPWVGPAGWGSLSGRQGRAAGVQRDPTQPGTPCASLAGPGPGLIPAGAPCAWRGPGVCFVLVCVVALWVEAGRRAWCGSAVFLPRVCRHLVAVERDRAGKGEEIAGVGGRTNHGFQLCSVLCWQHPVTSRGRVSSAAGWERLT